MPMGNAIVPLSEEVSLGKLISHALIPVPKKSVNASLVLRTQGEMAHLPLIP